MANTELLTIDTGPHIRLSDFDFLTSQQAKNAIEEKGMVLLDYRALQTIWKEK